MERDKKVKVIIIVATGIVLAAITGIVIYALRKEKAIMSVDEIMAKLGE